MGKVRISWTRTALKAVEAIGDYIAKDDPNKAMDFAERLLESTTRLGQFPMSGSICPEDASCRQLVVAGYRVIYELTGRGIEVLTVVGPGQNPKQLRKTKKHRP